MQISSVNISNIYSAKKSSFASTDMQREDISFGRYGVDGGRVQKFFSGFPCPCCGIERMLDFKDIKLPLHLANTASAEKIIPILEKYEKSMHPVEREVLDILKSLAQEHPEKNLRELLDTQRAKHLEMLHLEQKDILRRLREASRFLSPEEEAKLEETLKETEEILNDKTSTEQFKRRIFVGKVKYTAEKFHDKGIVSSIFDIAEKMPRASNSISAFIVKNTEKKPSSALERTPEDIVWGLLSPSLATIEHIKVRSPNIKHGGGKDKMSNFILECSRDNNERSCMRLDEFAKLHPEYYGANLQRFIDMSAEKINRLKAKDFAKYPAKVVRTLRRESKGMVSAKVPKIDIKNA